ncbi:hypothetical protein JXM67_08910 [candidate division WOR-3 bacterium]|nr:hypothetical protein [candidate division WOR-3 bacterium]
MRRVLLGVTTSLVIITLGAGCGKSDSAKDEPEQRTCVVMNKGFVIKEADVTYLEPEKDILYLGNGPYVWQGEDTIDFRVDKGLIYVNEELIGADLSEISPDKVPEADKIIVLTGVLPEHLPKIKRFSYLAAVEAKGISDQDMAHFKDFPYLKGLYLPFNSIGYQGLEYLKEMPHLRLLHIPKAPITDASLVLFKDLTNLRELNIGSTPITDEGIVNLAGLENLRSLNIHYTYVTDKGLKYLEDLKNLRELNLMQTSIDDLAVKKLKRALPNCTIRHQD